MANFVYHRVILRKKDLEEHFLDHDPFGDGNPSGRSLISFNRLLGLKTVDEYDDHELTAIDYEKDFGARVLKDGRIDLRFCTRWRYPVHAILKALELCPSLVWYAAEENHVYVSRFSCGENGKVQEEVMMIENGYDEWASSVRFEEELASWDDPVWYYLETSNDPWKVWPDEDGFERYKGIEAFHVEPPFGSKFR